jgi:SPP1 gp7 family putative phage head morphogenesis protein
MSNELKFNFQENLKGQRRGMTENKKQKTRKVKNPSWLYPFQFERKYRNFINKEIVKPLKDIYRPRINQKYTQWNKEVNRDAIDFVDRFIEDFENLSFFYKDKVAIPGNVESYFAFDTGKLRKLNLTKFPMYRIDKYIKLKPIYDDFTDDLKLLIQDLNKKSEEIFGISSDDPEKTLLWASLIGIATDVIGFNNKQWDKQTKKVLGFEYSSDEDFFEQAKRQWAQENYELLKGLNSDQVKGINEIISRGIRNGTTLKDLTEEIVKFDKKLKNRSKTIAMDQVGKLNGKITQIRQQQIGINEYEWITSADERVRPRHKTMNHKIMSWSDSTIFADPDTDIERDDNGNIIKINWRQRTSEMESGVIPGEAINCRCQGVPWWEPFIQETDNELSKEFKTGA